jgi:flavin reductase (DIM6/NTAB) family NADH-FMN oxidoreductase RutF
MRINAAELSEKDSYKYLSSSLVPRPLALITTLNELGKVNAAPYSFITPIAGKPPLLCFSSLGTKDTIKNILRSEEFVVNIVSEKILGQMNITGANYPSNVSEAEAVGFDTGASILVKVPYIKDALINLECRLIQHQSFGNLPNHLIIGEVVHFHISDYVLSKNDRINYHRLRVVGRLSGDLYCRTNQLLTLKKPDYDQVHNQDKHSFEEFLLPREVSEDYFL